MTSTIYTKVEDLGIIHYPVTEDEPNPDRIQIIGTISASNYKGIAVGSGSSTNIAALNDSRIFHEPTIAAGRGTSIPGQGPTVTATGSLLLLSFTPDQPNDRAYRMFKIPSNYVGEPSFHIHWTKTGTANESNKNVRWRIGYTSYNGSSDTVNFSENTIEIEDTYEDSGTTSKVVYRTPNQSLVPLTQGYYVSCYIEAISPVSGSALVSEPALVSMDLIYRATINEGN